MNVIARALMAVYEEVTKPESYVKGDEFEAFVRDEVFPCTHYDIVQRTHSYTANRNDFIESSKQPDFRFRVCNTRKEFFVEAKYRSGFYNGAVDWCKPYQLRRYRDINEKDAPVYIALGIGGEPCAPGHIFIIPVRKIQYTNLFRSFLSNYEICKPLPITYRDLCSVYK